jgi:glucose/mannose transport system substrate-binding protein
MKKLWLLLVGCLLFSVTLLPVSGAAKSTKCEIFSWWTVGGEATGLQALFEEYNKANPKVEIINAAVGTGAGSTAKAVLVSRMLGGDPPDSFQVHGGQELIDTWVTVGKMTPVTSLYKSEGWDKVYPKGIRDLVSYKGQYYAVPVGIHRCNVLWYNKKVFAKYGQKVPATMDDFFKVAEAFKAKGIIPLAMGSIRGYELGMTFETILAGQLGAAGYNGLWTGKTKWSDPKVTKSLEIFQKMLGYVNPDHSALSWDAAIDYVIKEKAAMLIQGDWVNGWVKAKKLDDFDYGWAVVPGTAGIYEASNDTFGIPKGAPHLDAAMEWLRSIGSKQSQEIFAYNKGCIPARTDADMSHFDDYLKWSQQEWAKNQIIPSCVHGSAAKESWATEFKDAINIFAARLDVKSTQNALVQAAQKAFQK